MSRKRSRPGNNRLDARTADRALSIVRERYADFGPTLAGEKLRECLTKALRLRGINTLAEANARAPSFMAAYNARFTKPPKSDFDAHRPLRAGENLELLMTWRQARYSEMLPRTYEMNTVRPLSCATLLMPER